DRCGIKPHLSIRDLRRTFGTRLHESAFDDTTVAQLLGHSDLRSIHRYKRGSRIKRTAVDSLVENSASPAKILPAEQMKKASNA
ncbi:MAG: tyrosine-type recombinase/integrase, partial [Pyrinomonadaceae bacterium]